MCFARPDTGSDRNIMTAAFAKEHNIHILQNEEDQDTFMMGNGQYTKSIGKALVPCKLLGTMSTESLWFHVMAKCSAPLIMGLEYLSKIKLYTENKHLLVDCPFFFGKFPRFKWIGAPKGMVQFSADGHQLTAGVDTGSDLDLMSLRCALRNGFNIDRSRRTQVMLADERIVETIGEVDISSIQLPGFDDFSMSFHVLPNLVCDVIFGEEFLEQTDTFNAFDIVDEEHDWDLYSLNIFVNLGRVQA